MKNLFYVGILCLFLFELLNIYFIMPMPGSQQMNSIDAAYFLYKSRWLFRGLLGAFILIGLFRANWKRKWVPIVSVAVLAALVYVFNFQMAADKMFHEPEKVLMANETNNQVDNDRLVIGVVNNGEAKAYPIRFLGYHHQVQDTVGGKPLLVTYCTVCRTGRVFEPVVNGRHEHFRLVGMDHFNAMLEDATTKSWWRQATGEAIAGKLKGQQLKEFHSTQTSLGEWLQLHTNSLVMQADPAFADKYDTTLNYESGVSRKKLTGTDSLSWKDKSWVVGIEKANNSKAYDWNQLKQKRLIEDKIGGAPVILVLAKNEKSFFAFDRPNSPASITIKNDTLLLGNHRFQLDGKGIDTSFSFVPIAAYQEFWHSWRTFHPKTARYE
jgi:hypothetical protein